MAQVADGTSRGCNLNVLAIKKIPFLSMNKKKTSRLDGQIKMKILSYLIRFQFLIMKFFKKELT